MPYQRHWGNLLVALGFALGCAACSEKRELGQQCPGPFTEGASLAPLPDGGVPALSSLYGTGCAPCDQPLQLDERNCPIYVTFESCGGDICIGGRRIPVAVDDPEPDDAGTDDGADAGGDTSDGGDGVDGGGDA